MEYHTIQMMKNRIQIIQHKLKNIQYKFSNGKAKNLYVEFYFFFPNSVNLAISNSKFNTYFNPFSLIHPQMHFLIDDLELVVFHFINTYSFENIFFGIYWIKNGQRTRKIHKWLSDKVLSRLIVCGVIMPVRYRLDNQYIATYTRLYLLNLCVS